jgi:pSer/pThr/pTyr-binding forkhead associated (FHA) protein/tetratricopeptide (TPR) repeat protein
MLKLTIKEIGCKEREFLLENKTYTMGRSEANDIIIADETVSRQHALIQFEDEKFYIEDRKSSTGLFVNGQKITEKTLLSGGETIKVGDTKISTDNVAEADRVADIGDTDEAKTNMISSDEYKDMLQDIQQKGVSEEKTPESALHGHDTEQEGDKTVLFDSKSPSQLTAPSYHKLVIISNKGYGKEYILNKAENFIGRKSGCLIQIDDKMASGQHAKVSVKGADCFIKDLNSTNGTNVNGRPLKDEQQIRAGDEIEVGSTSFRFIHKDSVFEKDAIRAPGKDKKVDSAKVRKLLIIGLAGVLVALLMVVLFSKSKPVSQTATMVAETRKDESQSDVAGKETSVESKVDESAGPQKATGEESAASNFSMANQFLANQLWQSAIDKYNEVLAINPEFLEAKEALEKAKFEQQNHQVMEKAKELFNAGQYEQAMEVYRLIPLESVYYQTAESKITTIEEQKKALAAKEKSEKEAAMAKQEKLAADIKEKAYQLIDGAMDHYVKGNVGIAMEGLDTVLKMESTDLKSVKSEVKTLQERMFKVSEGYNNGLSAYKNDQIGQAFQIWSKVLDLDKKMIGKRKSFFSSQIATYIADEYARQAQQALKNNEYEISLSKSIQALKAQPDHQKALNVQGRLIAKAKKLYEKAYIIEDLDPEQALSLWKEVMKICPPSNEYHAKAKKRIEKYE